MTTDFLRGLWGESLYIAAVNGFKTQQRQPALDTGLIMSTHKMVPFSGSTAASLSPKG
jgi:hypothetical protein